MLSREITAGGTRDSASQWHSAATNRLDLHSASEDHGLPSPEPQGPSPACAVARSAKAGAPSLTPHSVSASSRAASRRDRGRRRGRLRRGGARPERRCRRYRGLRRAVLQSKRRNSKFAGRGAGPNAPLPFLRSCSRPNVPSRFRTGWPLRWHGPAVFPDLPGLARADPGMLFS